MSLKKIRLELARTPHFPEGSRICGYEFTAPLDTAGKLDAGGWSKSKARCSVRRFWQGEEDQYGLLVHHRGNRWAFSYKTDDGDDEPIFRFDKHSFVPGEYVSVTEHDGVTRPFKVADVRPT